MKRMWPFNRLRHEPESGARIENDTSLPLVSILVRSMDRPTLQRALRSAARQNWGNVEIVVVAACGRKHRRLPDHVLGRPLRLVYPQPDARLSRPEAANVALQAAQGEWLNFLDDDDELLPDHLSTVLEVPRPNRESFVYSRARVNDRKGRQIARIGQPGSHVQLFFHSRSVPCAAVIHRSLIEEGVRFDPSFPVHEDHDFQIACATHTQFAFADAVTCIWNAQIGNSGCGFGTNDDPKQRIETVVRIRDKWAEAFKPWMRNFSALLACGGQYLEAGDLPAAIGCLEQALQLRPKDANALALCGMAQYHTGNLIRAEELLLRAVKRLPHNPKLRENLTKVRQARATRH